ncbi:MAG: tRNA (N6-isopentenyl adenosine(37)-C2)-methylthiotransferase MiaB [Thermoguttaceae bacterium]|nr:tRNA (N6-isopentenyl adenosine(37)-C2)-methylthiotransferase MiaB [Thermoguttaceae bacterium]
MKFYIETVGCQMNALDSELAAAELMAAGWERLDSRKDADLIIFNTCSVREHAEEKIYSALGRLKHWRTQKPGSLVCVMGCMAQKDKDVVFQRAPYVDVVVGPGKIDQLVALVEAAAATGTPQIAVGVDRFEQKADRQTIKESFRLYDPIRLPQARQRTFQAMVRIMFGCDKLCSYCIVPSVRGPEQSRSPKEILDEVKTLADQGCVEVTLLGQTVNSYRYHENGKTTRLADLLAMIDGVSGIRRVRFVSSYPTDMTDELLQAVRDLPSAMPYLHVPAQHGANSTLKRMRRHYTVEQYRELVDRIYETIPGAAITSDFIVGFSGETEDEFLQTVDLVRYARFKNSFIFKYSVRPGNEASRIYVDDVPEEVKKRRNNELLAVQNEISAELNKSFLGREVEILVEGPSKRESRSVAQEETLYAECEQTETPSEQPTTPEGITSVGELLATAAPNGTVQLTGRTECDRIVVFNGPREMAGTFQRVRVVDTAPFTLFGELL